MTTIQLSTAHTAGPQRRRQHGLSLVDMLVGLALGLFVISNGLWMLTSHLNENRLLLLEARLVQDLRVASTAISRDLRRAGHWGHASAALHPDTAAMAENPYQALTPVTAGTDNIRLRYSRDAGENDTVDGNEEFGFRLHNHAIDTLLGGSWQSLTDPATIRISSFRLTPIAHDIEQPAICQAACPPAGPLTQACPPRLQVRLFLIEISGESPQDPTISRSLQTSARVRNDALTGACPP